MPGGTHCLRDRRLPPHDHLLALLRPVDEVLEPVGVPLVNFFDAILFVAIRAVVSPVLAELQPALAAEGAPALHRPLVLQIHSRHRRPARMPGRGVRTSEWFYRG